MKKIKLVLPLLAFLFAVASAFASLPGSDENVNVYLKDDDNQCTILDTHCGAPTGTACDVTPPRDSSCNPIEAFRIP